MQKILVIDDHENSRYILTTILQKEGYEVIAVADGKNALGCLANEYFDLIMTDLMMDQIDGFDIIDYVKKNTPGTEVIVITAYGTVPTAVKAMKLGAYDYISKPMQREEILYTVQKALEKSHLIEEINILKKQIKEECLQDRIIGNCSSMQHVLELVKEVANINIPVLITGESGTGKELIARAIHNGSDRKENPFIAINCGALPENLLESEIFGHVKGAFTGAFSNKKGLFQEADQGTLFLDEIGELPLSAQPKLLRTLENNEIRPVGGNHFVKVHTRVIVATNKDLKIMTDSNEFRRDLFFRINVFPIHLPPLRDRQKDIKLLANYFLAKYSKRFSKNIKSVSEVVYDRLESYKWPGNVRELENIIERAVILTKSDYITVNEIPLESQSHSVESFTDGPEQNNASMELVEKETILRRLEKNGWNKIATAKDLGIGTSTLWRKIKKYNLEPHRN